MRHLLKCALPHRVLLLLGIVIMLAGLLPVADVSARPAGRNVSPRIDRRSTTVPPLTPAPQSRTVAPVAPPSLPSLVLALAIAPGPVGVGETAAITVTVTNQGAEASDLRIALGTPDGAAPEPGPGFVSAADGWRWDQPRLASGSSMSATARVKVTRMPAGEALLLRAEATARGLAQPVAAAGGAVVVDRAKGKAETRFMPGSPAKLRSADGRVELEVPAQAAAKGLTLRHATTPEPGEPTPPATAGFKRGLGAFFLHAVDDQGQALHDFARQPLTIRVRYTPEQLRALHIAEPDLTLFWFDEQATFARRDGSTGRGQWVPIRSIVDATTHTVEASVGHLSAFQIGDGASASEAFIPSVQGWQTSLFTGAASYSYPIDVPAGPGGLKPQVELSYTSSATDGATGLRLKQQAGWAGKGWSLDTGSIALNKVRVYSNTQNYYTLALNGRSYELVRAEALVENASDANPTQWAWRTTDESFIKVRILENGDSTADRGGYSFGNPEKRYRWQMWTKDGTRYDFEEDLWWGWEYCMGGEGDYAYMEPYRWQLTRATDTHGNTINYSYDRASFAPGETCFHVFGRVDYDSWPTRITWGGNAQTGAPDRYQVEFVSAARTSDTAFDRADNQYGGNLGAPHETRRLAAINVSSKRDAVWELVRQYRLDNDHYDLYPDTAICTANCDTANPTYGHDPTYPKLALHGLQRVAKDGASALPPISFSYGNDRGTAYFPAGDWSRLTGMDNGQGGQMALAYEELATALNKRVFNNYRRVTRKTLNDGRGNSSTWTYQYANAELNSLGSNLTGANDPNATQGNPNSAILYFNQYWDTLHDNSGWLIHKPLKEFRGHGYVKETDPAGTQTEHWFHQGEAPCGYPKDSGGNPVGGNNLDSNACFQELRGQEFLKGKEYRTKVSGPASAGSPALQETTHSFGVDFLGYSYHQLAGLWRAFSYASRTVETAVEGAEPGSSKTTEYFYDTTKQEGGGQYGNLTVIDEYDGLKPPEARPVRRTEHYFNTRDDGTSYLVDRPSGEVVRDGAGNLLAVNNTFYDGRTDSGVGAEGNATLTRTYFDVPLQPRLTGTTLHSSDTSFGYDAYGNRTSVTTYSGAGTRTDGAPTVFSAPGNGSAARTTQTTYDPVFHVFPTAVQQPNGLTEQAGYDYQLGTLTSVTDPNGNLTSAEYDGFGRLVKLIKPGDTSALPTVQATYFDTEQPFRYRVEQREVAGAATVRVQQQFYDGLGRKIQTKAESVDGAQNIVVDLVYDGLGRVTQQSQPRYVNEVAPAFEQYRTPGADVLWTRTSYDSLGRPLVVTAPDATTTTSSYAIADGGRAVTTVDANNHATRQVSDALGRLQKVIEYRGNNGTEGGYAVDGTTTYSYNGLDLLTQVVDALGNVTSMTYDSLGRKVAMQDPDMGGWAYSYDPNGNLLAQRDAKQQTLQFGYDALDRLITKTYPNGQLANYRYDEAGVPNGKGQRTAISNANATTRWQYDTRGRKTREEWSVPDIMDLRVFQWGYDSADRVTTLTYPSNEVVHYTYDAAWRQTSACSNFQQACYASNAQYTALDQPTQWTLGNGLIQRWTYNSPMQRLQQLQVGTSDTPGSIFNRSYTYDPTGNVATLSDNLLNPVQTQNFAYDHRDRLTRAWVTGNTTGAYDEIYSYNAIGNLLSKGGTTYGYPASGAGSLHPHAVTSKGGTTYSYDANGNLQSGGGRSLSWNGDNQPTSITGSDGVTETYAYDADGQRVKRTRGTVSTIYFAGLEEEDLNSATVGDGSPSFERDLYVFNSQVVAQLTQQFAKGVDTLVYLHGDHLGSISVATSSTGAVVSTQEYTPWGEVRSGGISETTLNYTGQRRDGTGLLFYGARYYDPGLARFVSADSIVPGVADGKGGAAATLGYDERVKLTPLTVDFHEPGFATGVNAENSFTLQKGFWFQLGNEDRKEAKYQWGPANPQALNRYAYVLNNPLRYTDPTGHTYYATHAEAAKLQGYYMRLGQMLKNGATVAQVAQWLDDIAQACQDAKCDPITTGFLQMAGAILGKINKAREAIANFYIDLANMIGGMNNYDGVAITFWNERYVSVLDRQTGMVVSRGIPIILRFANVIPRSWYIGEPFGNWGSGNWEFAADFDGSVYNHPCDVSKQSHAICERGG